MTSETRMAGIEEHEGSLVIGEYLLVFPKYPADCDYIRFVDRLNLKEIVYWAYTEWQESPIDVMGAIVGAMCEGAEYQPFDMVQPNE